MKKVYSLISLLSMCLPLTSNAQVLTGEDSLANGIVPRQQATVISGYGEASAIYNINTKQAEFDLRRVVLFFGHKFNNNISLFTEMELEHGLVVGNEDKGEVAMEQAFLKFNLHPNHYIAAGLFIPRIGIINENHLPTTFNGLQRPYVEQFVIPSTWREIGIGYYGSSDRLPGLNYSLALTNGLDAANFKNGRGIRDGRQEGSKATSNSIALSGSLLYFFGPFRTQLSTYIGGTSTSRNAYTDSLSLNKGLFANPVILNEANIQYRKNRFECKALASMITIRGTKNINNVFRNNTPQRIIGVYTELGYAVLQKKSADHFKSLVAFGRIEYLDLSNKIGKEVTVLNANKRLYGITGLTYKPHRGISLKVDYTASFINELNNQSKKDQFIKGYSNVGQISLGLGYNF